MRSSVTHNALIVVPRLGLEHPFLLDAIFGFTSLHLAYLKPSESHSRIADASRYQSQALAYCRQQLPVLTAVECQAMFYCSAVSRNFQLRQRSALIFGIDIGYADLGIPSC